MAVNAKRQRIKSGKARADWNGRSLRRRLITASRRHLKSNLGCWRTAMLGTKRVSDTARTDVAMRRASARRTAAILGVIAVLVFVASILNAMGII
jgi:hypothetical protein